VPSLAFVEIVDLPARMQEVTFFEWLEGKSDGQSPGVWFTSTGNAADFDGDGSLDITIAVAHGNFAIEMQGRLSKTDDIHRFRAAADQPRDRQTIFAQAHRAHSLRKMTTITE
jgi:hypothetical protein